MRIEHGMRCSCTVSFGLLFVWSAGCDSASLAPQKSEWNRIENEDKNYLNKHESLVRSVAEIGGDVTVVRELEGDTIKFSLLISFAGLDRFDGSALNGLLDGSPCRLLLNGTSVTDAALDALRNNPEIELLNLYDTPIGDQGLQVISTLAALKVLGIGKTRITDEGLSTLHNLIRLERLGLSWTEITDEGVANLSSLRALTNINLEGTRVSDDCVPHLLKVTTLQEVRLGKTHVTPEGVAALRREVPNCKIVME